jgi:hypothetical protein
MAWLTENPKNIPSPTVAWSPSDTLLKNFRATIEAKWKKFDDAVPDIGKSISDDYKNAKREYERSMTLLTGIKNDDELKNNAMMSSQLDKTLDVLNAHLQKLTKSEREEKYNEALKDMRDSLADLKWDITGKKELAEAAKLGGIAVAAVGAPALAGDVTVAMSEWLNELTGDIKKKWVGGMIKEFLGFNDASIVWDIRSAIETKKNGKGLDKFVATFSLMFHKLLAKVFWLDLSKHLKPEEMNWAGITPQNTKEVINPQEPGDGTKEKFESQKLLRNEQANRIANHLIRRDPNNKNTFSSWTDAIWQGVIDSTWWRERKNQKDGLIRMAWQVLLYPKIREQNLINLTKYRSSKTPGKDLWLTLSEKEEQGLSLALNALLFNETWIDSYMKQSKPNWKNEPLGDILDTFYTTIGFDKIHNIQTAIKWIDWSGDITALNSRLSDAFLQVKDGKITGLLSANIESFKDKWIDAVVMQRIFKTDQGKNTVSEFREQTLKNNTFENPLSQHLFTEITKKSWFSKNIVALMGKFGFSEAQLSAFDTWESLTVQELTTLYLLTEWETDVSKMSPGKRTEVYMALYWLVWARNSWDTAGKTIIDLISGAENQYMKEALEFVGTQINEATYITTLGAMGVAKESIDMFLRIKEESPKTFYLVVGGIIASVVAWIYLRKPFVTTWLIWIIITAGAKIAWLNILTSK